MTLLIHREECSGYMNKLLSLALFVICLNETNIYPLENQSEWHRNSLLNYCLGKNEMINAEALVSDCLSNDFYQIYQFSTFSHDHGKF